MALSRVAIKVNVSDIKNAGIKINGLGNALDKVARRAKNLKELPSVRMNATRKLKNMVYALAENIILNFNVNTHVGDIDKLMAGYAANATQTEKNYRRLYETRQNRYGLPVDVGYHAGAYVYSTTPIPEFKPEIRDQVDMLQDFKRDFYSQFDIRKTDVFYIGASGPAYRYMEAGVIGDAQGIIKPTIDWVMKTYAFDMKAAYDKPGTWRP